VTDSEELWNPNLGCKL